MQPAVTPSTELPPATYRTASLGTGGSQEGGAVASARDITGGTGAVTLSPTQDRALSS